MKKLFTVIALALLIMVPVFANGAQENNGEKVYTVAANCEWPPFEYVDESGAIVGFEKLFQRST